MLTRSDILRVSRCFGRLIRPRSRLFRLFLSTSVFRTKASAGFSNLRSDFIKLSVTRADNAYVPPLKSSKLCLKRRQIQFAPRQLIFKLSQFG